MKKLYLFIACSLSMLLSGTLSAANVTKVVITAAEPVVGEKQSFKANVPQSASTEIYEVHWHGEFEKGLFVLGNDYTITVKLRIKAGSPNIFATSGKINATINGKKAMVTKSSEKYITVRYTWKTLGGENPNNPKSKLKSKLKELAAAYTATNTSNEKEVLKYLQRELPDAKIWSTGTSYKYTRKMPTESADGNVSVPIGITYDGITLDSYNFTVVLPALGKSADATNLSADMALMKSALKEFSVTSKTTGDEVLSAINAAAIHGTKAVWDKNYKYNAPTANNQGSIDGNIIIFLGDKKDFFKAHKTLPIDGSEADASIDADFSTLSKALHNHVATNKTTQQELISIAEGSIKNGSKLTLTGFTKTDATYEKEGKVVISFNLENEGRRRAPRIALRMAKLRPELPTGISINQDEWEVLRLTNIERFKAKRAPLAIVTPLQDAGDIRAREIVSDCREDHLRPDGSNFYTAIDSSFISYRSLGENACAGAQVPSVAIDRWMHSPGHKANMLNPEFCYFGAGMHAVGSMKYWIQLFVGGNDIINAESSTGSTHFDSVVDMEEAYLICNTGEGVKAYVPLDDDYMIKDGNKYTIHLKGVSVTVTVGDDK